MGAQLLDFLLGAAVIALPQHQVPLLVGTAAVSAIRGLRHHKSKKKAAGKPPAIANGNSAAPNGVTKQQVLLTWDRIHCAITDKKGQEKVILNDVSGQAEPGRLLAIMGPSGGGKTSLLNALAGQVPATKGMRLRGDLAINGAPRAAASVRQAYVQQEDMFYAQLTVRETLGMAAALRLPKAMAAAEKEAVVERLIMQLGLAGAAGTPVGDAKARGLSGGEKKRLSIGCELLGSPALLFADEPTTGLDSFQAQRVMQTLKDLAGEGRTVVASIHQPRSSIFAMFDDLVLLSEGSLLYAGPAAGCLAHFEAQGFRMPENTNPAEFLADVISIDFSSAEAEAASRERVEALKSAFRSTPVPEYRPDNAPAPAASTSAHALPGAGEQEADEEDMAAAQCDWPAQAALLFRRSWRQVSRDKATNIARAMSNVSSAVIFGGIFWRMGRSQSSIQDRMGLLQVGAINAAMSSLVKTLNAFPKERAIVARERAKGAYDAAPYFLSKLAAESPIGALFPLLFAGIVYPAAGLHPKLSRFAKFCGILTLESFASTSLGLAVGAFAPSTDAALAIGPGVMVLFIVFGGYYVSGNVPRILRWIPSVSLIKHGFEGLCDNEFPGLEFETTGFGTGDVRTGDQVLTRLGFGDSSVAKTVQAQARVLAFFYWSTYCILKATKPRFQHMEPLAA